MFAPAVRKKGYVRLGLYGTAGTGKTVTALKLARELAGPEGTIAVLDTEHEAHLYAGGTGVQGVTEFLVETVDKADPRKLAGFMKEAARAGADVLVIDSFSSFWSGDGGAHEVVANDGSKDPRRSWGKINLAEATYLKAVQSAPMHIICLMRAKVDKVEGRNSEYAREIIRFDQRASAEYAMNAMARMLPDFEIGVEKVRCYDPDIPLMRETFAGDGKKLAELLLRWLGRGDELVGPEQRMEMILSKAADLRDKAHTARPVDRASVVEQVRIDLLGYHAELGTLAISDEHRDEAQSVIVSYGESLKGLLDKEATAQGRVVEEST